MISRISRTSRAPRKNSTIQKNGVRMAPAIFSASGLALMTGKNTVFRVYSSFSG
jgi:hypothetical protein